MTFLKLCALGLVLAFGLSLAACSGRGCRSDTLPVYPDTGKPTGEPPEGIQE